jgi:intracellular multiplication protein IcmP
MAGQAGGGQEQSGGNAYYILWVIALLAFVGGIIWWAFAYQLKTAFIFIRLYELITIHFFLGLFSPDLPWIGESIQRLFSEVESNLTLAYSVSPDSLTMEMADVLSLTAGEYFRYVLIMLLLAFSIVIFKTNAQMRLKKKFDMKSLARQEQSNWPQIKIATKTDILNEDLDSGPWSMALTPMQFSKKNKLIAVEFADVSATEFSKAQAAQFKVTLNRGRAERAFTAQLGRSWQGIENMAPHRRAVVAIFFARGNRDTKAASALVAQLAASAADGKLDCSGADELWKKQLKAKRVQEICAMHAYEFTLFISALLFAREDGVVASSDFLWIKPVDRRLWYVINNVGRQTPGAEVGGIFSHWYYEVALKRALSAPRIEPAVEALNEALSNVIYIPDEKEKEALIKERDAAVAAAKETKMAESNTEESMEQSAL